jgi:hypothetical protein
MCCVYSCMVLPGTNWEVGRCLLFAVRRTALRCCVSTVSTRVRVISWGIPAWPLLLPPPPLPPQTVIDPYEYTCAFPRNKHHGGMLVQVGHWSRLDFFFWRVGPWRLSWYRGHCPCGGSRANALLEPSLAVVPAKTTGVHCDPYKAKTSTSICLLANTHIANAL